MKHGDGVICQGNTYFDLIMWARYKDSTYLLHKADLRTINSISIPSLATYKGIHIALTPP